MALKNNIQKLLKSDLECLISRHFSKGLFKFFSDCFELLLLSNKFILKPVILLLQLLDRFVCKFCSCLCLLQFGSEGFDLFLVRLLALVGFFFSLFKILFTLNKFLRNFFISCICCFSFVSGFF